ncbi:diguanylate cyclase (GGDEF) domain-containing protein [Cohaesibacter sp. ES.047]|uniref:putative bifunctional diguanylate cyclase/phosphodiesterase n=1 Tax=Cohaesibacter sp. ES.047 TaxID=1798205 RepID=UPI000BB89147|nr:bifunctional diguanylate cyclase/phosphodiesterase [Cohaesibacter sp. ES.047]SNY89933.1 diguanylate cyclase (GGDEF) domain-containing protein [Cohaesibacter sp. ES.047]
MLKVLNCIFTQHNIPLVGLAVIICLFGSFITLRLLQRSVSAHGSQRLGWQFLAAVAGGGGIWATHFVAVLAYDPKAPISVDPTLTVLSLVIAVVGLCISFVVSGYRPHMLFAAIGGALTGGSFAATHYTGMFAYRIIAFVEWNVSYVVASIAIPVVLGALSLMLIWQRKASNKKLAAAVGLMVLGFFALHFTGMTALTVTPMISSFPKTDMHAVIALALAVSVLTTIILSAGITSYLIDTKLREASQNELHYLAVHDPLTGLENRSSFKSSLIEKLDDAIADKRKLGVIGLDLNRFKDINERMGHAAGDEVLRVLSRRMSDILWDGEMIARIGGDEFAAAKTFSDRSELVAFAERLAGALRRPVELGVSEIEMNASFGAAVWPDDARELDELVSNAELAVCHTKDNFLDGIGFYDAEIGTKLRERHKLADELRLALERDQLEVHYQVQVSLATDEAGKDEVQGFEALLRWTHPEKGPISPAEFIPVAEENGLIAPLGAWVLRRACRDAAQWEPGYRVAVNVSAVQFTNPRLPQLVHEVLLETGLSPHRLELELTETALVEDRVRSLHIMRQIKDLGVGIALDDFGTGYSSLDVLRVFPFDKIKLDKAFVSGIERDRQCKAIVRAVLALGNSLEIPVLAEGIETSDQLAVLRAEGCDAGQGFFLGRPSSMDALIAAGALNRRIITSEDSPQPIKQAREADSDAFRQETPPITAAVG